MPEMADGGWRAFSFGDGEKERTNESTRKTVFDGNCNGSDGHERDGTSSTTGRRQAASCFARYDWCHDASTWAVGGADATGGRFAARNAFGSIRGGSRHTCSGTARRRTEHGRLQEQFQIQGAYDGTARGRQWILFAERRGDSRARKPRGTGQHYGTRKVVAGVR